uniref:Uncharacterized protein n=1 Tax=Hucho hucho TaxID=62062 RepID=A0A4W5KZF1_9TELE
MRKLVKQHTKLVKVHDQSSNATGDLKNVKNPRVTENIHKQLRKYLQRTLQDWAPSQGELQCKLVLRDKLEEAAKNSQYPAWLVTVCHQRRCWGTSLRPTPPYYLKQEACLRRELKKIWQENAVLARRVQAGRKGITQTEQRSATAVEGECNRRHCASLAASLPPSTCLGLGLNLDPTPRKHI